MDPFSLASDLDALPPSAPVAPPPDAKLDKSSKPKKAKPPKAKKSPKASPKTPAAHPTYHEMVVEAIASLKERTGSSQPAIAKCIESKHKTGLPPNFKKMLSVQLKKLSQKGILVKVKNSYKLSEDSKKTAKAPKPMGEKKPAGRPKGAKAKVPKSPKKVKPLKPAKSPKAKAAKKPKPVKPKSTKVPKSPKAPKAPKAVRPAPEKKTLVPKKVTPKPAPKKVASTPKKAAPKPKKVKVAPKSPKLKPAAKSKSAAKPPPAKKAKKSIK